MLNVGELRKVLEGLPDDMPVGMEGYFSGLEDFDGPPKVKQMPTCGGRHARDSVVFPLIYLGEEPD